ncbi:sensor histidine kinase [Aestuariirhabdus litorea]|uniref:sensor histidine kinase n=1 Tax=Aestuariirhabdus litorea TaxID=2528527 RepID=UPI0013E36657|nr:ATP-binding protein [Aestuariirhabdus litorea]
MAFSIVAGSLAYLQNRTALDNLVAQAESSNVNLAKAFANSLWAEFEPLVNRASTLSREQLKNAPEQPHLYGLVQGMMAGTNALKVKVFNLEGLTVFSTEAAQIGDDKSKNAGYLSAVGERPASELTHRDTFSAFEQVVEDRDVISSYVPLYADGNLVGVFEIYSDMTPLIDHIDETKYLVLGSVIGLSILLYVALFLIVLRANNIIKEQAEENTRAQGHLANSDKMASLGRMVAGVAHELNTPLAFVGSNVSMMREVLEEIELPHRWGSRLIQLAGKSDQPEVLVKLDKQRYASEINNYEAMELSEVEELIDSTLSGVEQMRDLVVNLKNFTRIDRAKVSEYNLNDAIKNVFYIARSSIATTIEFEQDLGEIYPVACMPSQINQVLMNLMINAGQALGDEGKMTIRSRMEGNNVVIDVEDNGPGIKPEDLEHIFDAFYTTKGEGEGTGLGLSICKEIIAEHGGDLTVKTVVGEGSCFTVRLPVADLPN